MMKDSTMSTPEVQEKETSSPSQSMQMELHSKGAVLTKAWSDLFSFITKYQAELTVKENAVEIAEREIKTRKKQLEEMKPVVEAGNDEVFKLQEDIQSKDRLLSKTQSELSIKEQLLQQVQSNLSSNMELLEKAQCDLLDRQAAHVRDKTDLEHLKAELVVKEEQIHIKDSLLKKLQNQLMKENAELKEQLELERRALELERRSHEFTKRNLRGRLRPASSASSTKGSRVIEIPDSPPTLDQSDIGLGDITSEDAESQSHLEIQDSQLRFLQSQELPLTHISAVTADTFTSVTSSMTTKRRLPAGQSPSSPSARKLSRISQPNPTSAISEFQIDSADESSTKSDVFFPLTASLPEEDTKSGIVDNFPGNSLTGTEMPSSGHIPVAVEGMLTSGTSDNNQGGPVPVSGPIPGAGVIPGISLGSSAEGASEKAEEVERRRRPRIFRDREHPLDRFDDVELYQRFRFDRPGIQYLSDLLRDEIEPRTNRNRAIPTSLQVCIALRFYACGRFQGVVADTTRIHQSSVSRIIHRVSFALSKKLDQFVRFPGQDIQAVKSAFYEICQFPNVIGAVDGSHIRIICPHENDDQYVNVQNFHSINVQGICDASEKFTNIIAKYPGSVPDSRILRESRLAEEFDQQQHDGILLGDSGYQCKTWLLTPFTNPQNAGERNYNRAHTGTRNIIERTFGNWKRRFHCLHGELRYTPKKACAIIAATAVLHNIAKMRNLPDFDDDFIDDQPIELPVAQQDISGQAMREQYVQNYFNN